jgi:phosphoenolpyruvate carboxykinase (GTP)
LKWIFERCNGTAHAVDTPIGRLPRPEDLDTRGLDMAPGAIARLLGVDVPGWLAEVPLINSFFEEMGEHLPPELREEAAQLEQRLKK